ncbi:sugar ABC transporter substrate-binding protein [Microbacterium sp. CFH 90308]|uniref:Sugar ABC transporter substrate-binding protein n=1 Tax=Microbacterium salsuginis TaxID=2722803 RepID=A0ABX1KCU9_9MICO|nr:sugar ABC transporter substrate-binding protein [Microbacterium sp. CFH 90308]NLP84769.1 sugar ABC transporter substrate-binding protein [Microbacterium sp. CFH 90308]
MKMSGFTRRRRLALAAAAITATAGLMLAGCSSASDDPGATAEGGDVALYQGVRSLSNSYHANWVDGGDLFGESVGLEVNVITDEADSQRQLSQVRALGAAGQVYALNVDPNTSSDTEAIVRAVADAGGYVVTQWSKPDDLNPWDIGDNWVAHISFDGRVSGEDVATTLFEHMGGSGNIIAIQGILDNVAAQQRFEGLQNALAANPGIKLLEDQAGNFDRSQGLTVAQTLIAKYGDQIDGIWAANDEMALGALEALRAAGLQGQVPIVGFDAVPEALEAIQDESTGYLATVSTDPWWQGGAGLSLAYKAATGEIDVAELSHEQRAFYGTQTVVTADNVADFEQAPELSTIQPDFDDPWSRSQGPIE